MDQRQPPGTPFRYRAGHAKPAVFALEAATSVRKAGVIVAPN